MKVDVNSEEFSYLYSTLGQLGYREGLLPSNQRRGTTRVSTCDHTLDIMSLRPRLTLAQIPPHAVAHAQPSHTPASLHRDPPRPTTIWHATGAVLT